ncbi:MAG: IS66 family transposase [Rhodospirillales bacterium]|nr:IS66 family transposase [Rhodospirillales bacterium]
MMTTPEPLPADLAEAHAMILAERAGRLAAEAEAAIAKQTKRVLDLELERLKLEIARLRRQRFGTSSERSARLEQLELALTELQETVAQADAAVELRAAERSPTPARSAATPRKPARRRLPEHLPRTRVVYPAPATCPLQPLTAAIEAHVRAAARIHADETPVPVLAKGKTKEGRLWTVVRDDRPFGGPHLDGTGPPAAVFFYSPDRSGVHAERFLAGWTGIMQADAFSGFGRLYKTDRRPGPITEAGCWAHGRRGFFELAELQQGPIAIEAVKRIDALFAIEREINGASAEQRVAARGERSRPLILDLEAWLRDQYARLSAKSKTAKAIDYLLKRWTAFTRFLDDGRVCLSNNAAERALRGIAVGRRNWTFAGSDEGGRRAAAMYTLIETAKLNGIDPRAWLASVLARLPGHPTSRIHELLPWNWQAPEPISTAA